MKTKSLILKHTFKKLFHMAIMVSVPIETVTCSAVLKVREVAFDLLRQPLKYLGFLHDLEWSVADNAAAEGGRVLFEMEVADQCLKLGLGLFGLQKEDRNVLSL